LIILLALVVKQLHTPLLKDEVPYQLPLLHHEPAGGPAALSALLTEADIVRATVAANMIDNSFVFIVFSFNFGSKNLV